MIQSLSLGARYMLLSALGFALMAVCVKLVSLRGIPILEIVAARALVSLLISWIDIKRKGISPWGSHRGLLFARGLVGALALVCVYYALVHIPLAEATVLQYLHPMFTAVLALYFLKEKIHASTILCIVLSFLGLLLISRPDFLFGEQLGPLPAFAVAIAVLGAFGSAVAYVLVRKLAQIEDSSVIIFYFPLIALPFSLLMLGSDFVMPKGDEWLLLILVGIFTQVGQVGLTRAMQYESAGKATAFSYTQVLFAALFGWVVFAEVPSVWTCIGAGFILLGAFVNLMRK